MGVFTPTTLKYSNNNRARRRPTARTTGGPGRFTRTSVDIPALRCRLGALRHLVPGGGVQKGHGEAYWLNGFVGEQAGVGRPNS